MRCLKILTAAAVLALSGPALAQSTTGGTLKIGVIPDMNGVYAYVTGRGTVEAVRLAVEDAGGSVLGKKVEVLVADDQMKPDVAAAVVRRWIDVDGVEVVLAGAGSATTIAELTVVKEKNKTLLIAGAGSSDLTGKLCAINSTHWVFDTFGLASSVGKAVVADGGKTWFFITADYAFGHAMQRDAARFIEAGGGKVLGEARHPLNTADFSSFVLQAKSSGAQVVGLANAGGDLVNAIKQAQEFQLPQGGQRLAGLLLYVNDIQSLGFESSKSIVGAASFYHDKDDETRAWTKRYVERFPGNNIPNMTHAGAYAAVYHYLKAVKAAESLDPTVVGKKMRELPVNDFYNKNVRIRTDGRVLHDMMLWQAKTKEESTGPFDLLRIIRTVPGTEVFRPESEGDCPLVKK